jgi:NCS1 family nucleobase:cation symporter-1
MTESNQSHANDVEQEALSGRLPVLASERVYGSYGSFMWTCCTFSAATWAFLIGGFLPYVGDWRLGVIGYVIGLVIGMAIVSLASGMPSYKYGTDIIDTAKPSFGYRGIVIPLLGVLAMQVGWSYVVEALTSRGAANIAATVTGTDITGGAHETLVIGVALGLLLVVWLLACKGPKLFERLNGYIGPFHMAITVMMFGILIHKFGVHSLWVNQISSDKMLTHDRVCGLALAVEFGMSNAMGWWSVMGGLTRLVKRRNHIMGPSVIGVGLMGAVFVSSVAALAAISAGTYDPTIWMISLAGPILGSATMAVVLSANLATMVVMIYIAGVSIQQIKLFSKIKWELLLALMLLPGIYFAFKTQWLLSAVMSWLSYSGVPFVGVTGITFVDYFILRKEHLDPAHFFATTGSKYEFWGGVNWIAVAITGLSTWGYLLLYNPVTSETHGPFKYLGASLPMVILSGLAYYIATKLILVPLRKGAYTSGRETSRATLSKTPESGAVTVGL